MLTTIPVAPKRKRLASVHQFIQNTTASPAMKPISAAYPFTLGMKTAMKNKPPKPLVSKPRMVLK